MIPTSARTSVPLHIPARYMVVAVICIGLWTALAPWQISQVSVAPISYPVIAWLHLLTIGGIGGMILGASIQLIPVALQVPFPAARVAGKLWFAWIAGLVLFDLGFALQITTLLVPGATLLGTVLLAYAIAVSWMTKETQHRDVVSWHLFIAAWFAVVGFMLGWLLALTNVNGILGGRLLPVLAAHVVCMIIGWVVLTFLGVGYKLIGMFTLAERHLNEEMAAISGTFIVIGTVTMVITPIVGGLRAFFIAGAIMVAMGVIMAAREIARMYRRRLRKAIDVHMPFAIAAVSLLVLCSIALIVIGFQQTPLASPLAAAMVWLALAGAITIAIQGFFYKISTFLIWLHTYAPLAGRAPVPQLDAMYDRRVAYLGLASWLVSVELVALSLLAILPVWWGWSLGLWFGAAMFVLNTIRIGRHWFQPRGVAYA